MIRPEQDDGSPAGRSNPASDEPPAQDFWAYVQDNRERYPHLWRAIVRIHTRAFHLAYPDLAIDELWKLGPVILRDLIQAIEGNKGGSSAASPESFHLQMPIVATERQEPNFEGTWRGWLSVGKPERVY